MYVTEYVKSLNPVKEYVLIFNPRKNVYNDIVNSNELNKEDKEYLMNMFEDETYKFTYVKDKRGYWFKLCEKENKRIHWDQVGVWMRGYVWDFEKDNNIFQ